MFVATGIKALGRRGRHALSRRLGDDLINTGTTLARGARPPDRASGPPYAAARRVAESTGLLPHVSPVETERGGGNTPLSCGAGRGSTSESSAACRCRSKNLL